MPESSGGGRAAEMGSAEFLDAYREQQWRYALLAKLVGQFLHWRVERKFSKLNLPVLAMVKWREKSLGSLSRNLSSSRYEQFSFSTITDLAGVRLVFSFEDDLDSFCSDGSMFQDWFGIYSSETFRRIRGAKGKGARESVPGYDSYHFLVQVTPGSTFWTSLREIDKEALLDRYCEVQLRTQLRHAWAEAEHDLRYKVRRLSDVPFPERLNRQFSSLAARIEVADSRLAGIKAQVLKKKLSHPQPKAPVRPWVYMPSEYPHAVRLGATVYGYETLDVASEGQRPISVEVEPSIFDVDEAIRRVTGIEGHKRRMWSRLKREDPEFIGAITYDSTVGRALGWDPEKRLLTVQAARYSDQVVTNHKKALAKRLEGDAAGRTVRDLAYDKDGLLLPFRESPMSNTLGVACVARGVDRRWAIPLRSSHVAFDPRTWGCSVSGALDWDELGQWEAKDFEHWFKLGLIREAGEELGIEVAIEDVHYLCFARELGRAGKPQVFFFLRLALSSQQMESAFRTYMKPDGEYEDLKFIDDDLARDLVGTDPEKVQRVTGDDHPNEELRFNLALALRLLGEL